MIISKLRAFKLVIMSRQLDISNLSQQNVSTVMRHMDFFCYNQNYQISKQQAMFGTIPFDIR